MLRSRFFVRLTALALVGLFAVACDMRGFRVQLRAFESDQVRGVWLWRAAPGGSYQRFAQIEFGAVQDQDGREYLPYSFELNGAPVTLNSPVERDEAAPEDLTVVLTFGHAPGTYKVSSYNSAGESVLSAGTLNY
jgi:hypothetical protein